MIVGSKIKPKKLSFSAVVTRCGCGVPESHKGIICPNGKIENLGIISYWNVNPFKRLNYWFKTKILKERFIDEKAL